MAEIPFHLTGMGRRFIEHTMPNIATALLRIAERMENPPPAATPPQVADALRLVRKVAAYATVDNVNVEDVLAEARRIGLP